MYYFRCNKCGFYNPVDSEFLVYCGKCKTHLPDNYIDWVGLNPDKNFDDYKSLKCVTEAEVPKQIYQQPVSREKGPVSEVEKPKLRKKTKITKSQWIGIIVGLISFAAFYQIGKYVVTSILEKSQFLKINKVEFAAPDTTNWQVFTCDEANFEMMFPQTPVEHAQDVKTEIGNLKVIQYVYEPKLGVDANLLYGAGYTIYPPDIIGSDKMSGEQLETFFENSINGTVSNVQGKLLSTYIIDYNGYPGREINVEIKNGMALVKMRSYLIKNTMYIMQVISPAKLNFNISANYFLDSFKLRDV